MVISDQLYMSNYIFQCSEMIRIGALGIWLCPLFSIYGYGWTPLDYLGRLYCWHLSIIDFDAAFCIKNRGELHNILKCAMLLLEGNHNKSIMKKLCVVFGWVSSCACFFCTQIKGDDRGYWYSSLDNGLTRVVFRGRMWELIAKGTS